MRNICVCQSELRKKQRKLILLLWVTALMNRANIRLSGEKKLIGKIWWRFFTWYTQSDINQQLFEHQVKKFWVVSILKEVKGWFTLPKVAWYIRQDTKTLYHCNYILTWCIWWLPPVCCGCVSVCKVSLHGSNYTTVMRFGLRDIIKSVWSSPYQSTREVK